MTNSLPGYDAWLERPYQDAIDDYERYCDWCEIHNLNPGDEWADVAYQDWIDAQWEEPDYDEPDHYSYWMYEGDY